MSPFSCHHFPYEVFGGKGFSHSQHIMYVPMSNLRGGGIAKDCPADALDINNI